MNWADYMYKIWTLEGTHLKDSRQFGACKLRTGPKTKPSKQKQPTVTDESPMQQTTPLWHGALQVNPGHCSPRPTAGGGQRGVWHIDENESSVLGFSKPEMPVGAENKVVLAELPLLQSRLCTGF